ncbi:MAG: type II toxin-antitoxin system YafQ family toxin [Candidatus Promineofilum sp.]|jgi:mRNA-degrading endonuclease YafQ of YafQ-DinJ toxin-antitoxin module|nr:type II toxin-antitoxin system YafQ family toxin [Promineifilum sp.]
MKKLVLTPKFKRAYRKFTKHEPVLRKHIDAALKQMEADAFAPKLGAHKLSGVLTGLWACSCGYDCRIVFAFEVDPHTKEEVIILLDIGTHDEVY